MAVNQRDTIEILWAMRPHPCTTSTPLVVVVVVLAVESAAEALGPPGRSSGKVQESSGCPASMAVNDACLIRRYL